MAFQAQIAMYVLVSWIEYVVAMQRKFHMDMSKELLMKLSNFRSCKLFSATGFTGKNSGKWPVTEAKINEDWWTFVHSPKNQPDKLPDEHATTEGAQISVTSYVIRNYTNCCNVLQPNQEKEDGYIFSCNVSSKLDDNLALANIVLVTKSLFIHLGTTRGSPKFNVLCTL